MAGKHSDHYFRRWQAKIVTTINFGPSGVRALPLAAGINEGGHYFRYFFLFLVVVGNPPYTRVSCL